jgi:Flp pilus assembly protein TadG
VLILLYVGAVETGNLLTMYRRTFQVATTAADLTAQVKSVLTSDLSDVTSAASSIMTPYSTAPLNIVISSVVADQNNAGKVAWSYGSKGGARVNMTKFFSPGAFDIKRTLYARPCKSLTVTKTH